MLCKNLFITLALAISVAAVPVPGGGSSSPDPVESAIAGLGGIAGVINGQSPGSGDGNGNKGNGDGNGNNAGKGAGSGDGNGNGSGNSGNQVGTVSIAPSLSCNSQTPSQSGLINVARREANQLRSPEEEKRDDGSSTSSQSGLVNLGPLC